MPATGTSAAQGLPVSLRGAALDAERTTGSALPALRSNEEARAALIRALFDPASRTLGFLEPSAFALVRPVLSAQLSAACHRIPVDARSWQTLLSELHALQFPRYLDESEIHLQLVAAREMQSRWPAPSGSGKFSLAEAPTEARVFLNLMTMTDHSGAFRNKTLTPAIVKPAMMHAEQGAFIDGDRLTEAGRAKFRKFVGSVLLPRVLQALWYGEVGSRPAAALVEAAVRRLDDSLPVILRAYCRNPDRFVETHNGGRSVRSSGRLSTERSQMEHELTRLVESPDLAGQALAVDRLARLASGGCRARCVEAITGWCVSTVERCCKSRVHPPIPSNVFSAFEQLGIYPKPLLSALTSAIAIRVDSPTKEAFAELGTARAECIRYLSKAALAGVLPPDTLREALVPHLRASAYGLTVTTAVHAVAMNGLRGFGARLAELISQQEYSQSFAVRVKCDLTQRASPDNMGAGEGAVTLAKKQALDKIEIAQVLSALEQYRRQREERASACDGLWWRDHLPKLLEQIEALAKFAGAPKK